METGTKLTGLPVITSVTDDDLLYVVNDPTGTATSKGIRSDDFHKNFPFYNVKSYGAIGSGVIGDDAAIQAAIDAASVNGGIVYFEPDSYRLASGLLISAQERVHMLGYGATLLPDAAITAIEIHQDDLSGTCVQPSIEGLTIDGIAKSNNCIGILVRDSNYATIEGCRIINCGTGIKISNHTTWTEGTGIKDSIISWCTTGIDFTAGGTTSYAQTTLYNVGINDCTTGISQASGCTLYRSAFISVTIWIYANQKGVYVNGDVIGALWNLNIESFSNSNTIGIHIDTSAINTDKMQWNINWMGDFNSKVSIGNNEELRIVEDGYLIRGYGAVTSPRIQDVYYSSDSYPRISFGTLFPGGGGIEFGAGGASVLDTNVYRRASATIGTSVVWFVGSYATGSRPNAVTCGAGSMLYDSTTHKLQFSDGANWSDISSSGTLVNHDHSGDAGDGGTFDAANLTSGASGDGQILTSDGGGGAAWEDAPAGGTGSVSVATDPIWDAKGDLAAGTGANTASRLPVGTNGLFLKAASGEATGLIWAEMNTTGTAVNGWVSAEAMSTTGTSTIVVASGAANIYSVGDKLRLKQGGAYKYFYIVGIADTVLTVTGGSDYSLINAAITDNYYSKVATPLGFPRVFHYTCTETGWAGGFTQDCHFSIDGNVCTFIFQISGTSDSATTKFSIPVTAVVPYGEGVLGLAQDNNSFITTACRWEIGTSPSEIYCYKDMTSTAWTSSNTKSVRGIAIYFI